MSRKTKNSNYGRRVKLSTEISAMLHARLSAFASLEGQTISAVAEHLLTEGMKNRFHISVGETGSLPSKTGDSVDLSDHRRSA